MYEWKEENGVWYCYKDGVKVKGWVQDENNKWYHLNDKDSSLNTGWFQTSTDGFKWFYSYPEKLDKDGQTHYKGEMATGWVEYKEKWYYLVTEKQEYNSDTHYAGECVVSASITIDNKSYTFDSNGAMQTATISVDSLISDDCNSFVKGWEGFTDNGAKYYDCCGVLTQGYGMTGDEISDLPDVITEELASSMLSTLINKNYAQVVKDALDAKGVTLTQNQFDSLVTFAYNCGTGALFGSTLYKNVCAGITDSATILANFQAWSKGSVNGVMTTISGLLKRRNAECAIFTDGDYSGRP